MRLRSASYCFTQSANSLLVNPFSFGGVPAHPDDGGLSEEVPAEAIFGLRRDWCRLERGLEIVLNYELGRLSFSGVPC